MSDKAVGLLVVVMAVATIGNFFLSIFQGEQIEHLIRVQKEEQQQQQQIVCDVNREYRWYGVTKSEELSCGATQ